MTKSSTAVTSNGNSSISLVHSTTTTLENYLGVVTLKYDDADLNGITEADLVLEVQSSDGSWTSYAPSSVDTDNNAISYDFTSAVSFKAMLRIGNCLKASKYFQRTCKKYSSKSSQSFNFFKNISLDRTKLYRHGIEMFESD